MRVLVVCSANSGQVSPFISDQIKHLQEDGLNVEVFAIRGKGMWGYLRNLPLLRKKIREFKPQLIHAHSGMSALLSVLQRMVPVFVTFHGTDINNERLRRYSRLAMMLSKKQVVVSGHMAKLLGHPQMEVLPCGVDTRVFKPVSRQEAAAKLGLNPEEIHILFSSSFENPVKNYPLARQAIQLCPDLPLHLHPLSGLSRQETALMMNACHVCLLSSHSEGSPQFIKEAMACGTAIVSTHVGDVYSQLHSLDGCFVCNPVPEEMANAIRLAVSFSKHQGKTQGLQRIVENGLEASRIAKRLHNIYREIALP